ncbi:MAG: ABC transporter permease [Cyclobacteriaceae bacterium]|jgi:putative ABC transport system permease protein
MLKNYFLVALRNIIKQKFYAFINILGLTVGISATLFIILYVSDELSYDRFHSNIDNMYRVGLHGRLGGQDVRVTSTPPPLVAALKSEVPGIKDAVRLWERNNMIISYEELVFTEDNLFLTDSTFFDFFSFKLLEGDPKTALTEPNSIVLTKSSANKFFGKDSGLGKILTYGNNKMAMKVTGIVEDPPSNSHIKFNYLVSFSSNDFGISDQWLSNSLNTYFIKHDEANIEDIDAKLNNDIIPKYVGPQIQQFLGISLEQFIEQDGAYGYFINPVKDIHLYSDVQGELEPPGNISYIYIFTAIGLFILIIASINFMNLSTAKSAGRAREVGMRKTFGSLKRQLMGQFLIESIIYSLVSVILASIITILLLPQFNMVSGKILSYQVLLSPMMITGLISLIIVVGFLAGSYPAFYLTSFKITEVLKGQASKGMKSGRIRSVLVILQFSISILLIICTAIVYNQLQYTQKKNLGFNRENVMVIANVSRLENNRKAFKDALMSHNSIPAASYSNSVIPGVNNTTIFRKPGLEEDHIIGVYFGDHEHMETMGFELDRGRDFSRDFLSDSTAMLVNQAIVDQMEWDDPIGEKLISFNGQEPLELTVVGVLKNFNFESLRDEVRPLMIRLGDFGNDMTVRVTFEDPREAVQFVESKWKEFATDAPFEYSFLDEQFDELYRAEQRLGLLFTIFTILALFIASLGLFGLAAFTAEQRTKEIGIRKVMGASIIGVMQVLSFEFIKYIGIAFIVAVFPAYYFMSKWLENFAYRIDISVWTVLLSGFFALMVAVLTVSYQSFKAARINPAKTLRYE